MKQQGKRTDLTCALVEHKSKGEKSRDKLAEECGDSREQIRRYIRLTNLVPELLDFVDEGKIKMRPAVELSYRLKIPVSAVRISNPCSAQWCSQSVRCAVPTDLLNSNNS